MTYHVYILKSRNFDKFYYGQTQNLHNRLKYHNRGYSKYTKDYMPWELFAYKDCESRSEAMLLEKKLKNL